MKKITHHTIIISDIHLGSPLCKAEELVTFLKNIRVSNLILNGDIFEDIKTTYRLPKKHWAVLEQIRSLSDFCDVTWIKGNHDTLYGDKKEDLMILSNLLGIKMKSKLQFRVHGSNCLAVHGDQWDTYIYKYHRLNAFATWVYNRLKEIDSRTMDKIVDWYKRKSKTLMRNSKFVMSGALRYAKKLGCDLVVCGHTHYPMLEQRDNITYANCGTWESRKPTYVSIDANKVSLWAFEGRPVNIKSIEG